MFRARTDAAGEPPETFPSTESQESSCKLAKPHEKHL